MKAHIDPKAKITTDKWTGYIPLKADFENLTRVASGKKGSNFRTTSSRNLKSWLRGVHHHVNDLQDYLNEYCPHILQFESHQKVVAYFEFVFIFANIQYEHIRTSADNFYRFFLGD
jgi:hypothetical protein